jgi:hypothetical protein
MEKEITITLPESKARILLDSLHSQMHQLDELYEKNKIPRTKQSADVIEEIYEDIRGKIFD